MKKRNILQHVFLGLGMLTGGSIIGLDSANADTLKDTNGNPVEYDKSYYLEPKEHPGKGINHASWSLGTQWAYLESNTRGLPIQIKSGTSDRTCVYENTNISIQLQTANLNYSYLGINKTYNGIQLGSFKMEVANWKSQNIPNSRFVTFKNTYTNKYMNHQGLNQWLDATRSTQTADTQWKLVPQN
ncbi:hypothetical protein [Bacillus mycoides]|uniref:hypothetical protein n=1 Tax=Bacillus mycoides TaxID=1405 RepID=UPI0011A51145|nr:hypothetical protein [Bacillus mycoides]